MEYKIEHRTSYYYASPVSESFTVLHLQPRSDPTQFCTRYAVEVAPRARIFSYGDRFGNDVQHFAIHPPHDSLSIVTRSSVATLRDREPPEPDDAERGVLDADPQISRFYDYLHESAYVHYCPEIEALWAELDVPRERIGRWCREVCRYIHERFAYDGSATTVRSTVREALILRAGVCQDFAHVMIAVLRSAGVPARYASGYIFRGDSRILGAEASHAWCEAYLPPYGWVGFDPTNDLIVNDHFVKVAIGRDYRDVSPVRGVYRGVDRAEMHVNVAMDELATQQQQQQ